MDQLHPETGELSFNCSGTAGTVASCDWIRIELLLPPRHLATAAATAAVAVAVAVAAAAAARQIPRISLFSLFSHLFEG